MQCFDVIYDSAVRSLNSKVTFTFSIIIMGVQLFIKWKLICTLLTSFSVTGVRGLRERKIANDRAQRRRRCGAFDAVYMYSPHAAAIECERVRCAQRFVPVEAFQSTRCASASSCVPCSVRSSGDILRFKRNTIDACRFSKKIHEIV